MSPGGPDVLGEILLDRERGRDEVEAALGQLLALSRGSISVVEDPEAGRRRPPRAAVAFRLQMRPESQFPTRIAPRGTILLGVPPLAVIAALGWMLGCRCLVPDGSADPKAWLLVAGDGTCRPFRFDPEGD
jgi:hypothetical protein